MKGRCEGSLRIKSVSRRWVILLFLLLLVVGCVGKPRMMEEALDSGVVIYSFEDTNLLGRQFVFYHRSPGGSWKKVCKAVTRNDIGREAVFASHSGEIYFRSLDRRVYRLDFQNSRAEAVHRFGEHDIGEFCVHGACIFTHDVASNFGISVYCGEGDVRVVKRGTFGKNFVLIDCDNDRVLGVNYEMNSDREEVVIIGAENGEIIDTWYTDESSGILTVLAADLSARELLFSISDRRYRWLDGEVLPTSIKEEAHIHIGQRHVYLGSGKLVRVLDRESLEAVREFHAPTAVWGIAEYLVRRESPSPSW